jgi:hypothetical protein
MKTLQHLTAIAIITIVMGLIYVSVQQSYRSGANDPQIQIAHDIRDRIQKGKSIESYFAADTTDMQSSLAPFIEAYGQDGKPLQSTAWLDGRLPQLPISVLNYVKEKGEDWITWQPRHDIRMATGIIHTNSSPVAYVVVGRSLKEIEERVSKLLSMVGISWTLCMAIILISWLFHYYNRGNKSLPNLAV